MSGDRMRAALALVALLSARLASATDWPMYAGGPRRLFFNPAETLITAAGNGTALWHFAMQPGRDQTGDVRPPRDGRLLPEQARHALPRGQAWRVRLDPSADPRALLARHHVRGNHLRFCRRVRRRSVTNRRR